MVNSFMKITLGQRKYEIGVLESLGNDRKDIIHLLAGEQLVMSLTLILATNMIWLIVGNFVLEKVIKYNGIVVFSVEYWHVILVDIIMIILIIILYLR